MKLPCVIAVFLLVAFTGTLTAAARVQDSAEPLAAFKVRHDHVMGSGPGELRITATGIEFRGDGGESNDDRTWLDSDIRRIEFRQGRISVHVYEAARVPILPNHVPFSQGPKAIRAGTERRYNFRLVDGEVKPELVRSVMARFDRSIATTVLPGDEPSPGELLFEIHVFHKHVSGGESGVLRVFENSVQYLSGESDHSRFWRYGDIRDISRLGRYGFEIATFEPKRWTDGKSYVFDLKREMTKGEYDAFWEKLYVEK